MEQFVGANFSSLGVPQKRLVHGQQELYGEIDSADNTSNPWAAFSNPVATPDDSLTLTASRGSIRSTPYAPVEISEFNGASVVSQSQKDTGFSNFTSSNQRTLRSRDASCRPRSLRQQSVSSTANTVASVSSSPGCAPRPSSLPHIPELFPALPIYISSISLEEASKREKRCSRALYVHSLSELFSILDSRESIALNQGKLEESQGIAPSRGKGGHLGSSGFSPERATISSDDHVHFSSDEVGQQRVRWDIGTYWG